MTAGRITAAPTDEDWAHAIVAIKMIQEFDDATYRENLEQLARALEHEGTEAHRSADRLDGLSESTRPVLPTEHARDAILARITSCYVESPSHLATRFLQALGDTGLDVVASLRRQAAILLDAAQLIDEMLAWYQQRLTALYPSGRGHLANDTIAALMLDWDVTPTQVAAQLAKYGIAVTIGALAMALSRHRQRPHAHDALPGPLRFRKPQ